MKTCFIIFPGENLKIKPVLGHKEAYSVWEAGGYNGLLIRGLRDLEALNKLTLKDIIQHCRKLIGATEGTAPVTPEMTLDLLRRLYGQKGSPKKITVQRVPIRILWKSRRLGKGIDLRPGDIHKYPKPWSKRGQVLELISRPEGATLGELLPIVGASHGRNHVRVFLHDLNRKCGFGIRTEKNEPGNPRFFLWKGEKKNGD